MKKRSQRRKHCALAVAMRSQKFSPRRRPPSRERRTAKIWSAGDGHYIYVFTYKPSLVRIEARNFELSW